LDKDAAVRKYGEVQMTVIGLISPGQMGASIGAAASHSATRVIWAGDGRSKASHTRASDAGLENGGTIDTLVKDSDIILSVCPPHYAEDVARQVKQRAFSGLFVDCNAIAPEKSRQIAKRFGYQNFVDGGIVGGPAWKSESGTRLYLSGDRSKEIAALFNNSPLETTIIPGEIGAASAMKMVFAAYTKGTTALLAAILGVAEKEGVRNALESQWGQTFTEQTHQRVVANSAKAWRFEGEMQEIAATFENAGLPGGFHAAAAVVFERLAQFKDEPAADIVELLKALNQSRN
jgi:3-hydroxyisobutyrate dehydrogenase-like beta-hydroxyacid dehydrogenase